MSEHANATPIWAVAHLIRSYAIKCLTTVCGKEDTHCSIFLAIADSCSDAETCVLGHALIHRHNSRADAAYRIGAERCDAEMQAIATALGVAAA